MYTYLVEGKPSFWDPFSEYLSRFSSFGSQPLSLYPTPPLVFATELDTDLAMQGRQAQWGVGGEGGRGEGGEEEGGFRVAVMLTSDEKYFAPLEWIRFSFLRLAVVLTSDVKCFALLE